MTDTQTTPATETTSLDYRGWSILIPQNPLQPVCLTVMKHPGDVYTEARQLLRCAHIEPVHPLGLALSGHCLLVDELGRRRGPGHPSNENKRASYLYGTQMHGRPLSGDVLVATTIATLDGPSIAWLTITEAQTLMNQFDRLTRGGMPS